VNKFNVTGIINSMTVEKLFVNADRQTDRQTDVHTHSTYTTNNSLIGQVSRSGRDLTQLAIEQE